MPNEWVLLNERGEVVGHGSKLAMIGETLIFARKGKRRWALTREYFNTTIMRRAITYAQR